MMTKMEIATYIGMANILLQSAESSLDEEETEYTSKIREALCQAQLILTQQAITEFKEPLVAEYCVNDVIATEEIFKARMEDSDE